MMRSRLTGRTHTSHDALMLFAESHHEQGIIIVCNMERSQVDDIGRFAVHF